jgi:hypothetical protein
VTSFRASQIAALVESGWAQCRSVADAVARAGLPPISAGYLQNAFTAEQWHAAEMAVSALRDSFSAARFADEVAYGMVLDPDPDRLDTRRPMDPAASARSSVTGVRTTFHEQLDALLAQLSALCRLTEVALAQATHALLDADLRTAEQVITDHDLTQALAQRCEERAVSLLALQAPVARDFRTVVATLHLVDDLLRMGALAQHRSRRVDAWTALHADAVPLGVPHDDVRLVRQ